MIGWWPKLLFRPRRLSAGDLLTERIRLESISTAIGSVGVMMIALVMYHFFPKDIPQARQMGVWLEMQLIVGTLWLLFIAYHHAQSPNNTRTTQLWPYFSTNVCSFFGFMWGAGWVFFVGDTGSGNETHVLAAVIFTIVLGGVFTGGVLATIFHLPSLLSFTLFSLFPPLLSTFVEGGIFHLWFGATLVVYMLACTLFALNLHTFLLDTLEQREEKALLAKQLEAEKQRAEHANREKTRFLAAASHDLRQPLQALQFFQQALGELLTDAGQARQMLERMKASTSALGDLLNSLLDISTLDAGTQDIHQRTFPANSLLQRIYERYAPIAADAGLELRYVPSRVYLRSDPVQLERIIQNLVFNAIKHMGAEGRILLGVRRQAGWVRLEVWDNGVGIPDSEQETIFREFYQLNNPERNRSKGLGLGLSIVQRLAALLGHEIRLKSQLGKGCMFSVTLPVAEPPPAALPNIPNHPLPTTSKGKVLVIEDDESVLESLLMLLTVWGYTAASSDTLDPDAILAQHPDIQFIISDYQLYGGTGLELIQHLRQVARREIPAMLVTGNTSPALAEELKGFGVPVCYKPINPMLLKKEIGNYN